MNYSAFEMQTLHYFKESQSGNINILKHLVTVHFQAFIMQVGISPTSKVTYAEQTHGSHQDSHRHNSIADPWIYNIFNEPRIRMFPR